MKSRGIGMLLVSLCLVACQGQMEDANKVAVELIDRIQVVQDPDNVLRMDVRITLKQPATLRLEYWKDGNDSSSRQLVFQSQPQTLDTKLILLEEQSGYWLRVCAENQQGATEEKLVQFTTQALPKGLMKFSNLMPDYAYTFDGYIHVGDKQQGTLYLINSRGAIVWYQPTDGLSVICSAFDKRTKTFQAILGFNPNESFTGEYIYMVDLYGQVKLKKHYTELLNPYFHHDIQMLGDGKLAVVHQIRQSFDLTRWGGAADEMVVGDGFSVLNDAGQTLWTWSAFDTLSPADDPQIMGDRGAFEFPPRGDWLHANSIYPSEDGDYLISFNRISEVWKVNGRTGEVVYRLGKGGDVQLDDPADFPDRQHTATIAPDGSLMLYDNGYSAKRSRIMAYRINETSRRAEVTLKVILPAEDFSANQSSAYWMDNDRILFGSVVPKTIGVIDKHGNMMWHYKTDRPFYRALYITINH